MIKDLRQLHKFGGSSLADAQCYRRVVEILESYSAANDIVVVSAAGKTTNQLLLWLEQLVTDGRLAHATLLSIRRFQQQLISELLAPDHAQLLLQQLHVELAQLAKWGESPLTTEIKNAVLGHGELWSARLLAALLTQHQLAAVAIDSRLFLRADHAVQPAVDKALSQPLLQQLLA